MPDMNLEPGCDTCEHIADVRGITIEKPNTRWLTPSAVDELMAGLRATLEARTAALTRTIARAEKAEAERDALRAKVAALSDVVDDLGTAPRHWECNAKLRAVLEGGR